MSRTNMLMSRKNTFMSRNNIFMSRKHIFMSRKQYFYATVVGKNHAGLATFSSSVIALAPSDDVVPHGHVWDGVAVSNEDYAVDVDFQADRTTLSAHWSWTAGFEEDVVEYRWAIGTNNQHQKV